MIFEFLSRGEKVFAYGTLGCVFFNLTFQAIVTLYQNKAKPFKRQVKEQIYVWTLAKPGLDAWRVASESIHEEGSVINARQELTIDKVRPPFLLPRSVSMGTIRLSNTPLHFALAF
jgi:hypothetical protein